MAIRAQLKEMPLVGRFVVIGGITLGTIGAAVGLIVGLVVHAPTAPFAVVEVGLPLLVIGVIGGLLAGLACLGFRRLRPNAAR